jgi:hypothetical protein
MPKIQIPFRDENGQDTLATAHLQVRADGYLFLVWREGERIERRYLGKPGRQIRQTIESRTTTKPGLQRQARPRAVRRRAAGRHRR